MVTGMGKVIDADELLAKLPRLPMMAWSGYDAEGVVRQWVSDAPEAIVRCRDCGLWNDGKCDTWSALGVTILTAETGYCNFGERRDDGL